MADYLTPDQRRRIAGGLMAAQYDRATPEEGNVAQRHGLLPLATYDNGRTGLAFPGFVAEPVESMARLLRNGYQGGTGDTQGVEDAFSVAGGALFGGSAFTRPRGSLGMFGREPTPLKADESDMGLRNAVSSSNQMFGKMFDYADNGHPIIRYGKMPTSGWHVVDNKLIFSPIGWHSSRIPPSDIQDDALRILNSTIQPDYGFMWRGTRNRDELNLLNSGLLRRSKNHADGSSENGLSVMTDPSYINNNYPYGYGVRGRIIDYGADGEPLLGMGTISPATPMMSADKIINRDIQLRRKFLDQNQLTLPTIGFTSSSPWLHY